MADILLDAEVRMGEILEAIPTAESYAGLTSTGGRKPMLPPEITHKTSHQPQTLSANKIMIGGGESRNCYNRITPLRIFQRLEVRLEMVFQKKKKGPENIPNPLFFFW